MYLIILHTCTELHFKKLLILSLFELKLTDNLIALKIKQLFFKNFALLIKHLIYLI